MSVHVVLDVAVVAVAFTVLMAVVLAVMMAVVMVVVLAVVMVVVMATVTVAFIVVTASVVNDDTCQHRFEQYIKVKCSSCQICFCRF